VQCMDYRKPSGKAPVIHPGDEPPGGRTGNGTCVRGATVLYCCGMSKKQKKPLGETREQAPGRHTPTLLLELPLQVNAGQAKRIRGHLEAGRQLYNAVLSEGQRRLRRMRADPAQAGLHERCLAPASKSERRPFAGCGSSTASANTACTRMPKEPGKPGSRSTWMRCWPKPWPHAPIRPSTACAWARPAVCASRVAGAGSTASRTSTTIPACVSCCNNPNKAMTAT
jgi:hypothetical protein